MAPYGGQPGHCCATQGLALKAIGAVNTNDSAALLLGSRSDWAAWPLDSTPNRSGAPLEALVVANWPSSGRWGAARRPEMGATIGSGELANRVRSIWHRRASRPRNCHLAPADWTALSWLGALFVRVAVNLNGPQSGARWQFCSQAGLQNSGSSSSWPLLGPSRPDPARSLKATTQLGCGGQSVQLAGRREPRGVGGQKAGCWRAAEREIKFNSYLE